MLIGLPAKLDWGLSFSALVLLTSGIATTTMSDHDKEKDQSAHVTSANFEGELSSVGGIAKMRIWRKLDIHLLPLLICLYFLSFL